MSDTENTVEKTATQPGANGGTLLVGNPGNKGGTGRPKNEWKLICANLASGDETLAIAEEILKDKSHPAWLGAWKYVGEQAYGKAKEEIEHKGEMAVEMDLNKRAIKIAYEELQALEEI